MPRDTFVNTSALIGFSVQPFISAIILQLFFGVQWSKWFGEPLLPTSGLYPPGHQGFDLVLMLKYMILPTIVISIQTIASYSRYMRASLLDVLNSDYLRTARSKGISERRVLVKHALRNAMVQHPEMVSGAGRNDLAFTQVGKGDWMTKIGADGVQVIASISRQEKLNLPPGLQEAQRVFMSPSQPFWASSRSSLALTFHSAAGRMTFGKDAAKVSVVQGWVTAATSLRTRATSAAEMTAPRLPNELRT